MPQLASWLFQCAWGLLPQDNRHGKNWVVLSQRSDLKVAARKRGQEMQNSPKGLKTVKDVLDLYQSLREHPDLMVPIKSVLDELMRSGSRTELHNDSFADALLLTGTMIRSATFSFCMIIGQGVDIFLNALRDDVEAMLERFKQGNGIARVVLVSEKTSPLLEDFKQRYPEVFDFRRTTAKPGQEKAVRHFTVTDLKSYRLEHPHGPIFETSDAHAIKAEVCFNGPKVATERTLYFEQIWDYLASV